MPRVFEGYPVKMLDCIHSVYPNYSPVSLKSPVFSACLTFDTGDSVRLASSLIYFTKKDMITYFINKNATIVFKVNVETGEATYQYVSPERRKKFMEVDPQLRHIYNTNFRTMDSTQEVHSTHVTKLELFARDELSPEEFLTTLYPTTYYHPWEQFQDEIAHSPKEPKKRFLDNFKHLTNSLSEEMPDDLFLIKLCQITRLIWSLPVHYGMPFNIAWSDFCHCSDTGAALRTKDIVEHTTIDNNTLSKFSYKE